MLPRSVVPETAAENAGFAFQTVEGPGEKPGPSLLRYAVRIGKCRWLRSYGVITVVLDAEPPLEVVTVTFTV